MNTKLLSIIYAAVIFIMFAPDLNASNWNDKQKTGMDHLSAWKIMWQVDLSKGGLGKKLPNPITREGRDKLKEIHDFIDCVDGKHTGSGKYKRNGITHNPLYVATYFNHLYGYNWMAVSNAVSIHLILDMATGRSDDGVNGHKKNKERVKKAERLWDDIAKRKQIQLPDWSKNPGESVRGYDPAKAKEMAITKAKHDLAVAKNKRGKQSSGKVKDISDYQKRATNFGKVVKISSHLINKIAVLIVVYESGKQVMLYLENGEVDLKSLAEGAGRAVGAKVGFDSGQKLGMIIAGTLAGSASGAKVGLVSGAGIGTFACPLVGTVGGSAVGVTIGAVIGAGAGAYAGLKAGEYLGGEAFDLFVPVASQKALEKIHDDLRTKYL